MIKHRRPAGASKESDDAYSSAGDADAAAAAAAGLPAARGAGRPRCWPTGGGRPRRGGARTAAAASNRRRSDHLDAVAIPSS